MSDHEPAAIDRNRHCTHMLAEAKESPEAVARMLQGNAISVRRLVDHLRHRPPRFAVTCARGSSDHAATFAKHIFETRLGLMTASASPSIASVYKVAPRLDEALYLAISQSGRSPDLIRSAAAARRAGATVVAMVNDEASPLADAAQFVLPLRAGPESSVAATKSYVCALASVLQLAGHWEPSFEFDEALAELPALLQRALQCDWSSLLDGLASAHDLFVVGRGPGFGVAQEAALKLKETCGLHAEAFSAAEVRHGPMALVNEGFPVLTFVQRDESCEGTIAMAREFRARGAPVWIAGTDAHGLNSLPVPVSEHAAFTPVAQIVAFYRMVNDLALRRGFDPDSPPHLRKVTETT